MTDEELAEIKERAEKATEGPWQTSFTNHDVVADDMFIGIVGTENVKNNAYFIAHAREDIPKLLAEIERLRHAISWGVSCVYCSNQLAEDWNIVEGTFICGECKGDME